jgi:hypothetical protein
MKKKNDLKENQDKLSDIKGLYEIQAKRDPLNKEIEPLKNQVKIAARKDKPKLEDKI